MKLRQKEIGASLGLLAGTTMGSGIGFLLGWHSYNLMVLVSLFGFSELQPVFGQAPEEYSKSSLKNHASLVVLPDP